MLDMDRRKGRIVKMAPRGSAKKEVDSLKAGCRIRRLAEQQAADEELATTN